MNKTFSIGAVVGLQLLATLFTQLFVIRVVGLGPDTDAYIAAQTVPAVIVAIITTALQSVWLPRLAVITDDLVAWRKEQSIAQGQAGLLGGGLLLFVGVSLPFWLPLIFPGFDGLQKEAAMFYCVVLLVAAAINTQSAILTVALRASNRFMAAEVIALLGTMLSLCYVSFIASVGVDCGCVDCVGPFSLGLCCTNVFSQLATAIFHKGLGLQGNLDIDAAATVWCFFI